MTQEEEEVLLQNPLVKRTTEELVETPPKTYVTIINLKGPAIHKPIINFTRDILSQTFFLKGTVRHLKN